MQQPLRTVQRVEPLVGLVARFDEQCVEPRRMILDRDEVQVLIDGSERSNSTGPQRAVQRKQLLRGRSTASHVEGHVCDAGGIS